MFCLIILVQLSLAEALFVLSTDWSQIWLLFLKGSLMMRGYTFYMNITLNCSCSLPHIHEATFLLSPTILFLVLE